MIRLTILLGIAALSASAQVNAPLLGYLPDSGNLRPVYGIAAAAGIAAPLDAEGHYCQIAISSSQNYALASNADSGEVVLVNPGKDTTPIQGVADHPDSIVLSPQGSAAVLWFSSTGRLQVVSGLPDSPEVRDLNASFVNNAPSALAVSDDGKWIVGEWPNGAFRFGPNGETSRLPLRERAAAFAFFSGSHDLAIATRLHVFKIENGGPAKALYAGALDPAGLAVSADNRQVVLADRSGKVVSLDSAGASSASVDCGCAPDGLFSMGRGIFRLTQFNGATFKIFDAAKESVLIVPLAPAAPQGGQR